MKHPTPNSQKVQHPRKDTAPVLVEEPESEDYFDVVKDYKKNLERRARRKIMKERRSLNKRAQEENAIRENLKRNQLLNLNMLKEEEIWDVLLVDQEKGSCSETNTLRKSPDSKTLAAEYVLGLPWLPKKTLFFSEFTPLTLMRV